MAVQSTVARLIFSVCAVLITTRVECQITSSPGAKEVCAGTNVELDWIYGDAANFATVTWTYIDSSSAETIIMQHVTGSSPTPVNNYNVVPKSNGGITLTGVTSENSGRYKISVTYLSATAQDDDTVTVTVIDCSPTTEAPEEECECPLWECNNLAECIICWILFIFIIWLGVGVGGGLLFGICITCRTKALKGCYDCKASDCSECCQCCDNNIIRCKCCCSCFYIDWAPFWYYILWWTVIGIPVAFGIFIIMKCNKQGNGDVEQRVRTHTDQKKSETKKNKSKDSVAHTANEQHNQGRKQPPTPSDAGAAAGTTLNGREDSDGAVSREHVDLQESGRTLKQRPMPDIPRKNERQGHDSKGRGLSANFNDDDHPLIGVNIPIQKAGALEALPALPEGTGGDGSVKKLKKKKKKSKDQEDEV